MPAISLALPEPTYVAASGLERCCSKPSHTTAPAVSASAANSLNDSSALACVVTADDQTPTSTTRSRRTLRYSTSVGVLMPAGRALAVVEQHFGLLGQHTFRGNVVVAAVDVGVLGVVGQVRLVWLEWFTILLWSFIIIT